MTVELQDDGYQAGQQEPAEMLQAVVLALTENTGEQSSDQAERQIGFHRYEQSILQRAGQPTSNM